MFYGPSFVVLSRCTSCGTVGGRPEKNRKMGLPTLDQPDFVRRFAMRSPQGRVAFGAEASAAAGVPTAGHMIRGFKADLFASANKIARRELDVDDPALGLAHTNHFDNANGFPCADDPSEYQRAR